MLVFLHENITSKTAVIDEHQLSLPPGVLEPGAFLDRCTGCLTCLASCPFESIFVLRDKSGKKVPFLDPENHPCHLCDDMPCASSCPNGAVLRMPEHWVDMGTSVFDSERCLNNAGLICKMCYFACPITEKAMFWDDNDHMPVVNPVMCSGCGNCRDLCPTRAFSITHKSRPMEAI